MPGSLAEGVSPAAMLMGDRGPRRWESWAVGRSDWWWVCTDEGRLRGATLSLLSWLSVLVGFGRGPECLKNFTRVYRAEMHAMAGTAHADAIYAQMW